MEHGIAHGIAHVISTSTEKLNMNTPTEIIIKALRVLVDDIQSPDGEKGGE